MTISGVVNFEGLSAAGLHVLREFENKETPGIRFTFGPASDRAVVGWVSFPSLAVVAHMATLVERHEDGADELD